MDISGLNMVEISDKLKYYLVNYFQGSQLLELDESLFDESYLLEYNEIKHLIPAEYNNLLNHDDNFNGASVYVRFKSKADEIKEKEYVVMLISNCDYSKAMFLFLQERNNVDHTNRDILLADLMMCHGKAEDLNERR